MGAPAERTTAPATSARRDPAAIDGAMLALRSGTPLILAAASLLTLAVVCNQLGPEPERFTFPAAGWALLGGLFVLGLGRALALRLADGWIREHVSAASLQRSMFTSTIAICVALGTGIILVPLAVVQLSLMYLLVIVHASYFYGRRRIIVTVCVSAGSLLVALSLAPQPDAVPAPASPAALVPIVGALVCAGWFIARVRHERERLDEHTRIAAAIGLAEALDLRHAGTATHSGTVADYSAALARELGLSPKHVERVRVAGLLHDVGKIGIPDAVLLKPGALTDGEWDQMRRHPELGAQILDSALLRDVRAWVLAHHERPDGRGYPFGRDAADVPLEARILSVADAYEAMTADRVYRPAMAPDEARAELERCRGTQFDPVVVDAMLRILDRGRVAGPARAPAPTYAQAAAAP